MKGGLFLDFKADFDRRSDAFRSRFPDREIVARWETERAPEELAGLRYAVAWKPAPGLLARLPDLEVIFSLGAGVDHLLCDPALPDVPVVRFVDPDLSGRMVEWVVLQCLMHLRRQREHDAAQEAREWRDIPTPAASQVTVGLMGLGELGRASARALGALSFRLRGWSRTGKEVTGVETFDAGGLRDFLSGTDILVSLLPLTDETRGILDRAVIDGLRPDGALGGPVLVNAGRGASQNEADIAAALRDGRLRGASLDVFEREPLPADSPLWGFHNVVVTPHDAAVSSETALAGYVRAQVERFERGEAPENVVNRERGY